MKFFIKKYPIRIIFVVVLLFAISFGVQVKQGESFTGGGAGGGSLFGGGGASGSFGGAASPPLAFGGKILNVYYCSCSANLAVTVGPPVGGIYMYQPGVSILYAYYQIFRSGPWVLGTFVPGGSCLVYVVTGCVTALTPKGTMVQVGTSL